MKRYIVILIALIFIGSCEKNSTGSDKEVELGYLDLEWIWVAAVETTQHLNPQTYTTVGMPVLRYVDVFYTGYLRPDIPQMFYQEDVDEVIIWTNRRCEYIHFDEDEKWITVQEVGDSTEMSYGYERSNVEYFYLYKEIGEEQKLLKSTELMNK